MKLLFCCFPGLSLNTFSFVHQTNHSGFYLFQLNKKLNINNYGETMHETKSCFNYIQAYCVATRKIKMLHSHYQDYSTRANEKSCRSLICSWVSRTQKVQKLCALKSCPAILQTFICCSQYFSLIHAQSYCCYKLTGAIVYP